MTTSTSPNKAAAAAYGGVGTGADLKQANGHAADGSGDAQAAGNGHANGHGRPDGKADGFTTRSIHIGSEPDAHTGAVVPGLHVATTYKQYGVGKHHGFEYSRSDNPTRAALEQLLTSLETQSSSAPAQAQQKGEGLVFASGSAATAAIAFWAALQKKEGGGGGRDGVSGGGGHVLAVNDVTANQACASDTLISQYGGTARFLSRAIQPAGLEVTYLDFEEAGEQGIRAAIRPDTRLLWLELPTNPLLFVPPLPLISRIISSMDPATRPIVVVDTTFLSPFYCTPLIPSSPSSPPLGDIVLTSLSKYGSGHSDIILGSLVLAPHLLAARPDVLTGLRFIQNSFGGIPSPRDCHLMSRSLKTLSVRVLRHGLNALRIAHWLEQQEGIEEVRYPGLKTSGAFGLVQELLSVNVKKELEYLGWAFPYDERTKEVEQEGTLAHVRTLGVPFGGVVSFRIRDATEEKAEKFMTTLRIPALAESLGGVESLVEAPYGMTHAGLPEETRAKLGITPSLIRLSVGIEDVDDLLEDLEQALKAIGSA